MMYNAKKRLASMHWHNGTLQDKWGIRWLLQLEKEYL